jgi:hypothetical protein
VSTPATPTSRPSAASPSHLASIRVKAVAGRRARPHQDFGHPTPIVAPPLRRAARRQEGSRDLPPQVLRGPGHRNAARSRAARRGDGGGGAAQGRRAAARSWCTRSPARASPLAEQNGGLFHQVPAARRSSRSPPPRRARRSGTGRTCSPTRWSRSAPAPTSWRCRREAARSASARRAGLPDRVYDVGIAEQHAMTSAAGWHGRPAPGGRAVLHVPEPGVDQLLMDVAMHRLPVTVALDRSGVTGPDGASHSGCGTARSCGSSRACTAPPPWRQPDRRAAQRGHRGQRRPDRAAGRRHL